MTSLPIVSVVDVHKHFGDFHVLRGVSLDVTAGEVLCLIGASGSGKTTLLRCINQLVMIDSGAIWIDGDLLPGISCFRGGKSSFRWRFCARASAPRDAWCRLRRQFGPLRSWLTIRAA